MATNFGKEIFELPRVLRMLEEKGSVEYDRLVRQVRWGESPLYFLAAGAAKPVALAGAMAFESLCEWPAVTRSPEEFAAYSMPLVRPRTVLFFISDGKDSEETLELARAAQSRGAIVLIVGGNPEADLAKRADTLFFAIPGEETCHGLALGVCQHTAVSLAALAAARATRKPRPQFETLRAELAELPNHLERTFGQFGDAVRSFASEIPQAGMLTILAGGFYFPVALHAQSVFERCGTATTRLINVADPPGHFHPPFRGDENVLIFTGSRSRIKKSLFRQLELARKAGSKVLAITDGGDPEVSRRATLSLLLPTLNEMTGSILSLTLLGWIGHELKLAERRVDIPARPSRN